MTNYPIIIESDPDPMNFQVEVLAIATPEQRNRVLGALGPSASDRNLYLVHRYTQNRHAWFLKTANAPENSGVEYDARIRWNVKSGEPFPTIAPSTAIDELLDLNGY